MTAPDGVPEAPGRIDEGASTMTDATRVPQHTYDICAPDGTLEARHVRKDPPLGRKHVSWQLPNGTKGLGGRAAKTLSLYRSETLRALKPGALVLVCEGEKATDAAVAMEFDAVGTVTGSSGLPSDDVLRTLDGFSRGGLAGCRRGRRQAHGPAAGGARPAPRRGGRRALADRPEGAGADGSGCGRGRLDADRRRRG